MKAAAARHALGLSLLFLVVYGGTNWFTAQRGDVGTWYYAWELAIPFVAWTIIPYMSIDLFFVAAPFLCRDREELRGLSRRITMAIVVAGVCFLVLPLRVAFERPPLTGWLGRAFELFLSLDQPYNLLPSLHITLRGILAEHFAFHTRGWTRGGLHLWFSLIGFSTVLTYQHQVVDVVGGFMLVALCFYAFPRASVAPAPVTRTLRLAGYYGGGALGLLALGWWLRPWGAWLWWPALSLALMARAYLGAGPAGFRKHAGRLPWSARLVLGPVLLGQWLSWRWYARQCRPWDEVAPGVFIGRVLKAPEAAQLRDLGVTAVLDLSAEFDETPALLALRYQPLPILDLTAPTAAQLAEGVAFIARERERGGVFVHCKIGYSRSAAVVAAWLMRAGLAPDPDAAIARLRQARPPIVIRPEARAALARFAATVPVPGADPDESPRPA